MDATTARHDGRNLSHGDARAIVLGVLLPVFMGSLDATILASALPTIGRDLGNIHALPWLITAYLIAATSVTPLYGKISDIRGRRLTLVVAIVLYMAGSLVCALAPDMLMLIFGRVLHGLGGGGLTALGMVVLGDVAAPKDRGKYYGYFSFTYTTAGACGPALGGFLADHLHWSVIFWLNLPLGLVALGLTLWLLRRLPRHERPHRLDIAGAILIMAASVAFMLALNLAGVRFPWTSPPVLALFALALVLGIAFMVRLRTAPEPLIPLAILANPEARLAITANAFGWGAIIGLNIYLPMFLQSTLGASPTAAGLSLVVLMVTLNLSAGGGGQLIGRMRRYKTVPMIGLAVTTLSVLRLAWAAEHVGPWEFQLLLALIGLGFGPLAPLSTVVLQNSVVIHQFGTAVGTMNFTRSLYSTMLVAAFGAIVLAGVPLGGDSLAETVRAAQPGPQGFARIFLAAAASLAVAFGALVLLKEKPLQAGTP
jgi:MFS family permease